MILRHFIQYLTIRNAIGEHSETKLYYNYGFSFTSIKMALKTKLENVANGAVHEFLIQNVFFYLSKMKRRNETFRYCARDFSSKLRRFLLYIRDQSQSQRND